MDLNDGEGKAAPSETDSPEVGEDTVGYGMPLMVRRFKSGQSGNPKGRPRGSKNLRTIVKEIASERHTFTENGHKRSRSTIELMLLALRNHMAEGNPRALRAYKKLLAKYEPQESDSKAGYLVVSAPITVEEAIREGEQANAEAQARREALGLKTDL